MVTNFGFYGFVVLYFRVSFFFYEKSDTVLPNCTCTYIVTRISFVWWIYVLIIYISIWWSEWCWTDCGNRWIWNQRYVIHCIVFNTRVVIQRHRAVIFFSKMRTSYHEGVDVGLLLLVYITYSSVRSTRENLPVFFHHIFDLYVHNFEW